MDALYIIDSKTHSLLISKEYKGTDLSIKLQQFLFEWKKTLFNNSQNEISQSPSPYIIIDKDIFIPTVFPNNNILNFNTSSEITYIPVTSEDNLIPSILSTLKSIHLSISQAFDCQITTDNIRDNMVEISLMIDQYIINATPVLSDINTLSSLISPYNFKDKLTEKFIGKAKDYDTRTLSNCIRETQTTYDTYRYTNENIRNNYEILFHYNAYVEMTCDRNYNQINKIIHSEIDVFSQIPGNIDLNLLLNIPFNILDFSVNESVQSKKKDIIKKKNMDCSIRHGNYCLAQIVPIMSNNISMPFKVGIVGSLTNNIYNLSEGCISTPFANWNIGLIERSVIANLKGHCAVGSGSVGESGGATVGNCVLVLSCKIDKYSITGGCISKAAITRNPKGYDISKKGRNFTIVKNLEIVF